MVTPMVTAECYGHTYGHLWSSMVTHGHLWSPIVTCNRGHRLLSTERGSLLFEHLQSARKVCGAGLENFNALDLRAEIGEIPDYC